MKTKDYKGGTYVATEPGESLSVEPTVGHLVLSNGTRVQVRRAWVDLAANSDSVELVPANAAAVIRIVSLAMVSGATATTVTLESAGVAIGPPIRNAANGGMVLPFNIYGWFQGLAINEAIQVTTSNHAETAVIVQFIELTTDLFDLL
jgi:hypothetical protein